MGDERVREKLVLENLMELVGTLFWTTQKTKFSIQDFVSNCYQIRRNP